MELVWIPRGLFDMGSPSGMNGEPPREFARSNDEGPLHRVTISKGFWMGRYEVTQAEWQAVMGSNPSHFPGERRPVDSVSWHECQQFCRRLSNMEGRTIRLPTEAEWEYAARAGLTEYRYGDLNDLNAIAWTTYNASETHEVGLKQPNPWGLFDVFGNVEEWCGDWEGTYSELDQTDPAGPDDGRSKIARGGFYRSGNGGIRAAERSWAAPDRKAPSRGFRVVMEEWNQPEPTATAVAEADPSESAPARSFKGIYFVPGTEPAAARDAFWIGQHYIADFDENGLILESVIPYDVGGVPSGVAAHDPSRSLFFTWRDGLVAWSLPELRLSSELAIPTISRPVMAVDTRRSRVLVAPDGYRTNSDEFSTSIVVYDIDRKRLTSLDTGPVVFLTLDYLAVEDRLVALLRKPSPAGSVFLARFDAQGRITSQWITDLFDVMNYYNPPRTRTIPDRWLQSDVVGDELILIRYVDLGRSQPVAAAGWKYEVYAVDLHSGEAKYRTSFY